MKDLLRKNFVIPPFSILDTRQQYWQDRKRQWISLGLKPEVTNYQHGAMQVDGDSFLVQEIAKRGGNVSIFDPVLCEIMYKWFCPKKGKILDPFAGGSVRGIVATELGYEYVGIEIRPEQVESNWEQYFNIFSDIGIDSLNFLTPVQEIGNIKVKRDDLFSKGGVCGGKARTCFHLGKNAKGLVTAGSRVSPQINIVAHVAKYYGIPCHCHTPNGDISELKDAQDVGAEIIQHTGGYNNVIISHAKDDAKKLGWTEIPFGMECQEAVNQTKRQTANIPSDIKRIVISVGSGMSLCGILWGLKERNLNIPVLGVCVGANPTNRLKEYAPSNWTKMVELIDSGYDYHKSPEKTKLGNLELDPIYEAKTIPFLKEGDLLWIVGHRKSTSKPNKTKWVTGDSSKVLDRVKNKYDFVFTCPPYYDLEVYSDLTGELSAFKTYKDFLKVYKDIIIKSVEKLKDNRFACYVVTEIRDEKGYYRNFVSDTINIFNDHTDAKFYNDIILVNSAGTLPIRVQNMFVPNRKVGRQHQNVLVFYKGDIKNIEPIDKEYVGKQTGLLDKWI